MTVRGAAPDPGDCLGRKLLILGDVNTGKTTLARRILDDLCRRGVGTRIAIVDLAPHIPPALAAARGLKGVGGRLAAPAGCAALCLHAQLAAPRLSSASEAEAIGKAQANLALADGCLQRLAASGRSIVFVNDVSMYLQAGTAEALLAHLAPAETLIVNGYWGQRLGGGELSRRERAGMERLRDWFAANGTVLTLQQSFAP